MTRSAAATWRSIASAGRKHRVERAPELPPQRAQHFGVAIQHPHLGAHPKRDVARVRAHDAAAEHDDVRGNDAGDTAQQDATPAVRLFQIMCARLHGKATRHLGHRRQQRQAAVGRRDRFVRDAHRVARDKIARLVRIGREMQIGKQDLPGPQQRALDCLRLLDLDDHVGGCKHFRGRGDDLRAAALAIGIVVHANALTCVVLDHHLMAVRDRLAHAAGHQPDAIFQYLDFLRDADAHAGFLELTGRQITPAPSLPLEPASVRAWCQAVAPATSAQAAASVAIPGSMRAASIDAKPTRA